MSACNGCKLKCEFTESRKSATRLRRCAIARRHARSLCAATGTVAPPLLDGRKSVSSSAHANMRATTDGAEIPRSGNSPPRRAIVLGYSPRPCARSRTHRRPVLSMVENRSRRAPTPTCTASIGVTGYPRSGNSLTATQILTATRTSAVTCGRSCVPLALEPVISPLALDSECVPQAGPSPSASMRASGTRHARGPLPSPIRPSKRPLPIHSTRCATYSGTGPRGGSVSLS